MKDDGRVVRRTRGDGRWFPGDGKSLRAMAGQYIDAAEFPAVTQRVAAALAPHAGYVYSGKVAGYVFRALRDQARAGAGPETAVILGFSHRAGFRGVALMDGDAIRSPLGEAALDKDGAEIMTRGRPQIFFDYSPHSLEHSAENEIPFVQIALPETRLIVGIMGDHAPDTFEQLQAALCDLAGGRRIVVVASTDMLHDPDYELVSKTDRQTLKLVERLDDKAVAKAWQPDKQIFCGIGPVLAAMRFARSQGCERGVALNYRNSGDDFPESRGQWVVGYGAVVFPVAGK